jgi:hypothetical protein
MPLIAIIGAIAASAVGIITALRGGGTVVQAPQPQPQTEAVTLIPGIPDVVTYVGGGLLAVFVYKKFLK